MEGIHDLRLGCGIYGNAESGIRRCERCNNTLKYHIDLIFKTSTDPMYGITTEYMTYKVEQITVDGDLAYVVIYGG